MRTVNNPPSRANEIFTVVNLTDNSNSLVLVEIINSPIT